MEGHDTRFRREKIMWIVHENTEFFGFQSTTFTAQKIRHFTPSPELLFYPLRTYLKRGFAMRETKTLMYAAQTRLCAEERLSEPAWHGNVRAEKRLRANSCRRERVRFLAGETTRTPAGE